MQQMDLFIFFIKKLLQRKPGDNFISIKHAAQIRKAKP